MDKLLIKLVDSPEDFEGALAVRLRVFVQEQDVPLEEEGRFLQHYSRLYLEKEKMIRRFQRKPVKCHLHPLLAQRPMDAQISKQPM